MPTQNLLFIRQNLPANRHIEDGIQRAASNIHGLCMAVLDLWPLFKEQQNLQGAQPHSVLMNQAIQGLLKQALLDTSDTVLLLNGFVLEKHCPGFFATLRKAGKAIIGWEIDEPYYIDMTRRFAPHLDWVLTVDSSTLPVYVEVRKKAEFLPLACDPLLHRNYSDADENHRCQVCFLGTPFLNSRRTRLIDSLAGFLSKYETRIVGNTRKDSWSKSLSRFDELEACTCIACRQSSRCCEPA